MKTTRLAMLFLLLAVASASAETVQGTATIPLFIPKAQCSQIPGDITGTLTINYFAHQTIVNGVTHQGERDTVQGTATDTLGNQYVIRIGEVQAVSFTTSNRQIITFTSVEQFILRDANGGAPILHLVGSLHITVKPDGTLAVFMDNVKPFQDQGCFPV